ncbi:asparaginase [Microbacterium sp. VKM Ac-2923]|uniref:asparaginase n=1 Tax=Microbacterium sp. VKM Ac-2923 TaxID=2929476 RepID=UPI001FB330DA|nr:asparaginase [Microbacterium sp. VKM Ac-2923]MCJ1708194.1 asparaginase [Microbacterium sp. VKM Ac-2923]
MPTPPAFAELAVVDRNGFIESRHHGVAVVLAPDGAEKLTLGDATAAFLPRSSMKPLQALACLSAGVELADERLAISMASHCGTDRHAEVARGILQSGGLTEDDLGCPAAWPTDTASRDELVRDHGAPSPLRMNCSGKHAAMLLTCVANGWATEGYLDAQHPLQVHIREVIERLVGERITTTAIDGCGAPVYAMSLVGLARAIQRIATSSERSPFALHRSAGTLVRAVREHPWTIDGPGRPDTVVIERLGVFSKMGAEGVQVMTAPDGTTVALKMLDGSNRAGHVVALRLLERVGALAPEAVADVAAYLSLSVLGGGHEVGAIRSAV